MSEGNNDSLVALPREVVEQVLEALGMMGTPSPLVFLPDEIQSWQNANEALRAALEQPQVEQELVSKSDNYLNGYCAGRTDLLKEQQREQEPYLWHDPVLDQFWTREDAKYMDISGTIPLYTHPQNLRCKSNQARLATLWGYVKADQPQGEQEPVSWIENFEGSISYGPIHEAARKLPEGVRFDLYTHPQPKREQLTDEQIAAATGAKPGTPMWLVAVAFTRAIEAAHDIRGEA